MYRDPLSSDTSSQSTRTAGSQNGDCENCLCFFWGKKEHIPCFFVVEHLQILTTVYQQKFFLPVSWPQFQYFPESKVDPTSGVPSASADPKKISPLESCKDSFTSDAALPKLTGISWGLTKPWFTVSKSSKFTLSDEYDT